MRCEPQENGSGAKDATRMYFCGRAPTKMIPVSDFRFFKEISAATPIFGRRRRNYFVKNIIL